MDNEQKLLGDYYYLQEEKEKAFQNAISFPFELRPKEFLRPGDRLPEPFTLAAPKSKGEFSDGVIQWARSYEFDYDDVNTRRLSFTNASGSRLLLERSSDILKLLKQENIDYGILGAEKVFENQGMASPYYPVQPLCFGRANLCLGFKDDSYPMFRSQQELLDYLAVQVGNGKLIGTSLYKTAETLLNRLQSSAGYKFRRDNFYVKDGSIENMIDAFPNTICAVADIVESGDTSLANGIRADYRLLQIPGAFVTAYGYEIMREYKKEWEFYHRPFVH